MRVLGRWLVGRCTGLRQRVDDRRAEVGVVDVWCSLHCPCRCDGDRVL